ncbi:MAG: hypothetical protein ACOCX3_00685 [Chloroflexota bacterium]
MTDQPTRPSSNRSSSGSIGGLPPDHIGILVSSVVMIVIGWGGLALLISSRPPRLGAELWLFFVLLHFAVTGTVLPIVRYLNVRFTPITVELPPGGVIVRQSVWMGLLVVITAWLQILRVLSATIVFFLILIFVVLEVFLRSRERNAD